MADLQSSAAPAVEKLLGYDRDALFAELGLRQKAIEADPSQAGMFEVTATYEAEFAGPLDVLKEFGQKYFDRVNKDVYALVCGDDTENAEDRKKLAASFGLGKTTFAAMLAGILVSSYGLAPAIAAVVAALVVRLFFKNAYVTMCQVWKGHLQS